jgi:hypothetical protein
MHAPGPRGTYVQPRSTGANREVFGQYTTPEVVHEENELTREGEGTDQVMNPKRSGSKSGNYI